MIALLFLAAIDASEISCLLEIKLIINKFYSETTHRKGN